MTAPVAPRATALERATRAAVTAGLYPAMIPGTDTWSVESSTNSGRFYTVRPAGDTFLCNCEARGLCRHIAAVLICLERGVRAVYCQCPNCSVRVYRTGQWCASCQGLQEREAERMAYRAQVRAEAAAGISPLDAAFN